MIRVIVPAYNEEANIGRLIQDAIFFLKSKGHSCRLTIVDDGSTDRTAQMVRERSAADPMHVSLVHYAPNRGVHEAFRRGFRAALAESAPEDIIVTMEADGTADLDLLPIFIERLQSGLDVIVASYYAPGGRVDGTPWHRRFLSRAGNLFIRAFLPIRGVSTYSSFYRAYRPRALQRILEQYGDFYDEKGFSCVVELLYRLHRAHCRIGEVPMVLKGQNRIGKSKMKITQTILGYLKIGLRSKLRQT